MLCVCVCVCVCAQVSVDGSGQEQTTPLIRKNRKEEEDKGEDEGEEAAAGGEARSNRINIGLLFVGGVLYDVAVAGAMEILVSFQMKEPLNWNAKQVHSITNSMSSLHHDNMSLSNSPSLRPTHTNYKSLRVN